MIVSADKYLIPRPTHEINLHQSTLFFSRMMLIVGESMSITGTLIIMLVIWTHLFRLDLFNVQLNQECDISVDLQLFFDPSVVTQVQLMSSSAANYPSHFFFSSTEKLCIEVTPASKIAFISEELCIGCGICVKVCNFTLISYLCMCLFACGIENRI